MNPSVASNELEPHEDMVLIAAAERLDRREMAREAIAEDGLVLTTQRDTKRAHPLLAVEHSAALEFLRIVKQLGLSGDGRMRPPVLRQVPTPRRPKVRHS